MAERLVAIPLDGVMRLYSVNGDGPVEVGRLDVGALDVHALAIVGAALSDLRGMVTSGQLSAPRQPVPMRQALAAFPSAIEAPRRMGPTADPDSLNGRIRAYLAEHGPTVLDELQANVGAQPSAHKTVRQRVSTALSTLRRQGMVKREGSGFRGVWSLVGDAPASGPRRAVSASMSGPGATAARYGPEP